MKIKKIIIALIFLMVLPLIGSADGIEYSAVQSGDALIVTGNVEFHGITITGDGTNSITVDIHNGTTVSGEKITPTLNFVQSSSAKTQVYGVSPPVNCNTGIYINVTTAGTISYVVYFKRK